jgi:flagellar hook protein FlgE
VTGNVGDIQTQGALLDPSPTTTATITGNLDSREAVPSAFDVTNSATYNATTSIAVFDSLGNSHTLDVYFRKTANNTYDVYTFLDGTSTTNNATTAAITGLPFTTAGAYDPTGTKGTVTLTQDVAGAASLSIALDITGFTQYGTNFATTTSTQNGYSAGQLASLEVNEYGLISARYSNGISKAMGQFALADFQNVNGLQPVGNTNWIETYKSGMPTLNKAGNANLGLVQGFALEQSNVAITQELVDLIVAQRNFQANAQVVQAEDAITQTVINLR